MLKKALLGCLIGLSIVGGVECYKQAKDYFYPNRPINKPLYTGWCEIHAPVNMLDGNCLDCQVWIARDRVIFEQLIKEGLIKDKTVSGGQ